jgi:hypothetical protein
MEHLIISVFRSVPLCSANVKVERYGKNDQQIANPGQQE